MKTCNVCGASVEDSATFCTKCGAKMPEAASAAALPSMDAGLSGSNAPAAPDLADAAMHGGDGVDESAQKDLPDMSPAAELAPELSLGQEVKPDSIPAGNAAPELELDGAAKAAAPKPELETLGDAVSAAPKPELETVGADVSAAPKPELTVDVPVAAPAAAVTEPATPAAAVTEPAAPAPAAQNAATSGLTLEPEIAPVRRDVPPTPPVAPNGALRDAGFTAFVDAFGSQLMLIICILTTASLVLPALTMMAEGAGIAGFLGVAISEILGILTCVALWRCHLSAKKVPQGGTFDVGGLSMYRVCFIISFVFLCIVSGLMILVSLAMLVAGGSIMTDPSIGSALEYGIDMYGLSGMDTAGMGAVIAVIAVFMLIVMAGILAMGILSFVKMMRTLKALMTSATNGYPTNYISTFLIVVYYIGGGFMAIGAIGSMVSSVYQGGLATALGVLTSICSAALMLLTAFGMQQYKKITTAILAQQGTATR